MTFYAIVRWIVEVEQQGESRAKYGRQIIKNLSEAMNTQFGRGYSVDTLENARKFYLTYQDRISETVFRKFVVEKSETAFRFFGETLPFTLPWSHYLLLMRIKDENERKFYEIEATQSGWSIRTLQRQYNSSLYERLALSREKGEVLRLASEGNIVTRPQDIVKQPTVLEFLGLDEKARFVESDLETAIINKLQIYNSAQLTEIDRFASDSSINVMIINSQAFNAKGKDARRIYMKLDEFRSRRPIDIIGKYAAMFEEEYEDVLSSMQLDIGEDEYIKYLQSISAARTHTGYFSMDGKGKMVNSKVGRKETTSDDVSAYELIMKNKELLLDRDPARSPVRFIFSHSALREGWDNPNVFQICTLKQSGSDVRKRQVGRGLRLCVNQNGERMDTNVLGNDVHNINILTVIASESYDSFAKGLQTEMAEAVADRPRAVHCGGWPAYTYTADSSIDKVMLLVFWKK